MKERVRAVLVTSEDTMLVIRRTKPDIPEYWVLPGGGVEPSDESREAALHREIHEEIAGKADIVRLLHTMESDDERQLFYLARIATWSFEDRTGPEFSAEGRGEYALEEIPLTVEGSTTSTSCPRRSPTSSGAPSELAPFGQRMRSSWRH